MHPKVSNGTFDGLKTITILSLRKNFIEELGASVFTDLVKVEELDLGQVGLHSPSKIKLEQQKLFPGEAVERSRCVRGRQPEGGLDAPQVRADRQPDSPQRVLQLDGEGGLGELREPRDHQVGVNVAFAIIWIAIFATGKRRWLRRSRRSLSSYLQLIFAFAFRTLVRTFHGTLHSSY